MFLELTPDQRAFKASIDEFATEIVAPRAALIDKTGEYPSDVMHAAASHGLLGVTIPKAWGGAGRDSKRETAERLDAAPEGCADRENEPELGGSCRRLAQALSSIHL